ncbi:2-hydroxyacid dehydrogenase [Naematelia encephala]|uniref:2-hydroxyacid dehydrogenase n=1 Tax=Naematelia encephala TaxID=71784 RepID=A0A1Y2AUB8_9TREE|nr:2-hydroxyacid dehydrogenase [Naematelia encephala]
MLKTVSTRLLSSSWKAATMAVNGYATSSAKPQVLFLDSIKLAKDELESFQQIGNVVPMTSTSRSEFISDLGEKYAGATGIYRHFKASESIQVTGRFDAELVSKLPSSVKFICHNGAGYDQIDIDACTSRGIQVSNVPSAVDDATADTAMFLLIGSLRQFNSALAASRDGTFNSLLPLANDPKGKLLGIIGLGGIGTALAKRARPFGMTIQYHNRRRLPVEKEAELGVKYVPTLDELLETSDVVSLNLPLNANTKHLISDSAFKKMKSSAVLINTARGPVVDEAALVRALQAGEIAGCGLDVYENEPHITPELLAHPQALCLPHVGTVTVETQTEMEAICLRNLAHGLKEGKLAFTVPEQSHLLK